MRARQALLAEGFLDSLLPSGLALAHRAHRDRADQVERADSRQTSFFLLSLFLEGTEQLLRDSIERVSLECRSVDSVVEMAIWKSRYRSSLKLNAADAAGTIHLGKI